MSRMEGSNSDLFQSYKSEESERLRQQASDSVGDKLRRAADDLDYRNMGLISGMARRVADLSDHKAQTGLEMIGATALGAGLALATKNPHALKGLAGPIAEASQSALAFMFLGDMGRRFVGPLLYSKNAGQQIQENLGAMAIDYGLMGGFGVLGTKLANPLHKRLSYRDYLHSEKPFSAEARLASQAIADEVNLSAIHNMKRPDGTRDVNAWFDFDGKELKAFQKNLEADIVNRAVEMRVSRAKYNVEELGPNKPSMYVSPWDARTIACAERAGIDSSFYKQLMSTSRSKNLVLDLEPGNIGVHNKTYFPGSMGQTMVDFGPRLNNIWHKPSSPHHPGPVESARQLGILHPIVDTTREKLFGR